MQPRCLTLWLHGLAASAVCMDVAVRRACLEATLCVSHTSHLPMTVGFWVFVNVKVNVRNLHL